MKLTIYVGLDVGLKMAQITDLRAKKITPGEKPMADGAIPGLWLHPGSAKGQGKWILRFVSPVTGKRRDMGLGTYPQVGIADARIRGMDARRLIDGGKDPIEERDAHRAAGKAAAEAMTFEQAARRVHEEQKLGWRTPKHADQSRIPCGTMRSRRLASGRLPS